MKRAFIVHRWDGSPRADWYPWLKTELQKKGFKTAALKMPDPDAPKIGAWVKAIKEQVGKLDEETYFVGHSIGCQAIIRYLGSQKQRCAKAVFVGGWFMLTPEATPDAASKRIAQKWLLTPIPFEQAKAAMKSSVAVLSDNDPFVPVQNAQVFEKTLNTTVIIQKRKGHFTKDDGITKMPIIVKELTA